MELFKVENLSFAYPEDNTKTLDNISFTVKKGDFVLLCGKSGCGKTTLLRLLKPSLSPSGTMDGSIFFGGRLISSYDIKEESSQIGFVMQNPDNQIITDKVWHELAFGLESLSYNTQEIRARVSETASFFGIENWFYKNVDELSGGQKQLLCLASVMAMQPSVLILDEPTSQLDPIAAADFLRTLEKINRELGTTIILSEQRLEEAFPLADKVIVMDDGKISVHDTPEKVGEALKKANHPMHLALPTPVKVWSSVENSHSCPLTVGEGRLWLEKFSKDHMLNSDIIPEDNIQCSYPEKVIEIKDAWFKYEKNLPDVVKGLNLVVGKGEFLCIVGGNGTGKTTALSLISGLNTPYRGEVIIGGTPLSEISNLYDGLLGVLPQNPQSLFVKKTVNSDLLDMLSDNKSDKEEKISKVHHVASLCHIENLLNSHPYDLSGGEQQRVALATILLKEPKILLLDEPTKGMDAHFKEEFAEILYNLKKIGTTIIMVSHDIEFCASFADRCALFFDGNITSSGTPREFFKGKCFYTTSANRMARFLLPDAVLAEDIIMACGGITEKKPPAPPSIEKDNFKHETKKEKSLKKNSPKRIFAGGIFLLLLILLYLPTKTGINIFNINVTRLLSIGVYQIIMVTLLFAAAVCFFPQKEIGTEKSLQTGTHDKMTKSTILSSLSILILIPLTIFLGVYLFGSRKYYFISLLIILETIIPFFMMFEKRKPKARELVVISVLCALAVAGRAAFFMLPQFKPVVAIIIIAGICLGGETGFLTGAVTGFVSNFFFGQGPWAPWQMFAFGIIGFTSGIIFRKGLVIKTRATLCIFGFLATLILYGGIMNPASVIMWQSNISWDMILSSYVLGLPFDLIHALSTAFFLWFISEPMIDKLERVKIKYGLIDA